MYFAFIQYFFIESNCPRDKFRLDNTVAQEEVSNLHYIKTLTAGNNHIDTKCNAQDLTIR